MYLFKLCYCCLFAFYFFLYSFLEAVVKLLTLYTYIIIIIVYVKKLLSFKFMWHPKKIDIDRVQSSISHVLSNIVQPTWGMDYLYIRLSGTRICELCSKFPGHFPRIPFQVHSSALFLLKRRFLPITDLGILNFLLKPFYEQEWSIQSNHDDTTMGRCRNAETPCYVKFSVFLFKNFMMSLTRNRR